LDESDTTLIIFNFFLALILEKSSNSSIIIERTQNKISNRDGQSRRACGAVAVRQGNEARISRL
jgi:hypothetical protein